MGNYKRIYGNGIFVTKLNAKELILKKINADTNWVDIYTSAFVLGEDLNTIGSFMISPEISELISKYSSSLFDPDASFETKIQFIEKNISEADTEEKVRAYTELLERVKIAEELRILGKILKINQGMPTNTADFYEYISKIEYYIESRLNKQLIDKYNGVRNLTSAEWIGRKKYYDTTVFPYKNAFKLLKEAIKKYGYLYEIEDLLNSDKTELIPELEKAVTTFEDTMRSLGYIGHSYWRDYKAVQEAYSEWYEDLGKVINELKENWKKFSIVRFVKDEDYAQTTISEYESTKVKFNILDVLKSLPHFNEMYKVLALNDRILTVLSKRNEIESKVWQKAIHKYSNGNGDILMNTPNKSERKILKSLVDDALIQTWLTTGLTDFYLSSPDGTRLDFDGNLSISKLKSFIETSIIPRLRNNKFIINGQNIDTKSNEFVRRLTFGKNNGESIFKLPFNMSEIDSNPGIKQEYEKILQAFGELRNIHLEGGLTIVDVFYLYNLIVHKDHFGRNSLTRLFEDLISSKDGEKLLVFKFNEWLETVNENEIIDKVLSSWGASHRNDLSLTGNSTQVYISTNPLNKSILFYSGGADGSDSAWGMYLRQQGFTVKDYTVNDWRALSAEQKEYYEQLYQAAINLIGTEGWPADSYPGELTRRDMMQADSATSIFAIGTLSNSGKVNGGTKYATYAAISQGKPVYLFNLNNNSWYWYDYNSSSFIRMNDKPNLISGAAVIGTRDDKSKIGAEALRASGHEAIKDIIDRSLKLSAPKTKIVKYTPEGQAEQTYTIVGNRIYNKKGEEVHTTDGKHRRRIFANLALSEGRAVMISYNGTDYIINNRNQILSTRTNDIMQWPDNNGNRIAILERAKEEFAKLQNIGKSIDINTISNKTEAFGVVFPKQGKTSQALKSEYQQWQIDNPTGIVAYRVKFPYNTVEEVQLGHIGNPFSENERGANTVQQFYDWLVTGNNFGNEKATDEYRRAIISKLLSTPADSPILYYTELNRPSHATVLGYLIANKQLLSNQSSPNPVQFDDSIDISEESVAEEPVTIGFDNTSDRVSEESNESSYIEPIRRLQLLDDYYRPIFTSEELISFEEDAKRIFDNESILNERINIHYSEWKILDDITDMRRWEKIWEDIVYDGNAEESENDFKYNNKSKTVQIPKYIYDRIKLYQKYQKLVDFLMGIAQKNNYYDYYGNLLRHDEDWFGDLGGTSLDILKDLYDLAGIKEIYDDPNQLRLFDSLHIDSDYIAEREEILRNAPRNSEGQLLAPNGKVSKLTEEQWVTVRTRAFKEWFGDWELFANIPEELLNQVSLVYERIPELVQIGTPVEYAAYLQSIFPNSKDKSIYWHGSDSDFSRGFDSAVKGKGSGSPHIAGEFYLAKQAWTVLQYVSGVNRIFGPDINGFNHWNKLWWELKEIMSNGRRHNNAWKDLVIGPENVRQGIPNKRGVFNRDSGGTNGKWLKERKADYGYQDRSDEEFFRDVFGIEYGKDTFNTWTQRNAEIFRSLEKTAKGIYPAIINATNPIRESGQNTYYEPERGLLTRAILNKNDAILGSNTDNEFNSDVAVVFNAAHNVHFLGTNQDIEAFKLWLQTNRASKVIDPETGEPMVVYHSSKEYFTEFNHSKSNTGAKDAKNAFYFSSSRTVSSWYTDMLHGLNRYTTFNTKKLIEDLFSKLYDNAEVLYERSYEIPEASIYRSYTVLSNGIVIEEEYWMNGENISIETINTSEDFNLLPSEMIEDILKKVKLVNNEDLINDLNYLIKYNKDYSRYYDIEAGVSFNSPLKEEIINKYFIRPFFLNIRNIKNIDEFKNETKKSIVKYLTEFIENDGFKIENTNDSGENILSDIYAVRNPNQIKSATGAHKFTSSPNIYDADPTPVYQTTPSKQSKLIEVVRQAREKGIKGLHAVSQSDLIYENIYIRSALGFVRNGEIYINVDRAGDDTVIHEFGHLYLADAKVNNRERYYELLEKVRQTKLWSDMKTWKAYANKIGSDFDEEVLATMIGDYYKSEFGIDYEYTDLVKEALSLVDGGFIDLINSEILPDLGDTFITNYALSQRTATLKHKLVSDNILKENCL